jgi:hypothetical protein
MVNDTPIMLYQANLMVCHGLMPYRDFFCINLPGSLGVYALIIKLFGISDVAVHVANLAVVVLTAVLMYFALAKASPLCAVLGVSLGVLRIFSGEVAFILEREILALVAISALVFVTLRSPFTESVRSVVVGGLLSGLFLIKPQLVLYGIPSVALLLKSCRTFRSGFGACFLIGTALLVPVAACGVWLFKNGAWPRFSETVAYWGLYGQMTQSFTFVEPQKRVLDICVHMAKMIFSPYMALAGAALWIAFKNKVLSKDETAFWSLLLAMTVVVPALSGQFWGYHRLPFFYYTLCAAGYLLSGRVWATRLAALVVLFWVSFTGLHVYRETTEPSAIRLTHGIADEFTRYLQPRLRPEDRVQPIDWTYGAVQGMLATDALPATRFIEFSYFLHSVNTPLIHQFRQEFLASLNARPPRFLLEATTVRWPNGLNTEARFADFDAWRDAHYSVVQQSGHYRIWEWCR